MSRSLTVHLAIVFARARPVRWFAVVVAIAVAAVTTVLISAQAFQQSPEQQAQLSTGRADYMVTLPDSDPLGAISSVSDHEVTSAMRAAGASDPRVGLEIYQVPIDGHEPLWMNLTEHDWSANPFPSRYLLMSGRLPLKPSEVAISQTVAQTVGTGHIELAGATLTLNVVGVIRDEANREAPFGMVAPGTWALAVHASEGYEISATRVYYWNSEEPPDAVVEAVGSRLVSTTVSLPTTDDLLVSVVARRDFVGGRLYSELGVVLLLVPLAVGLIGGWAGSRFVGRIRETLMQIGIARTAAPGAIAIMGTALIGSLLGVGAGLAIGLALRPVLDTFSNRKIGPMYGLESFGPLMIYALLLGTGLGMLSIVKGRSQLASPSKRGSISFHQLTPAFSLILIFAGLFTAQSGDLNVRFLSPFAFGAAVVMWAPLALRIPRRFEPDSLAVVLALRRLDSDQKITAGTTVGVALVLMLSFSTLLVTFSVVTTANEQELSRVPPGHLHLAPPPQSEAQFNSIRDRIEDYSGVSNPVVLTTAAGTPEPASGPIMIVEGPDDAERLLAASLSTQEAASMERGFLIRYREPLLKEQLLRLTDEDTVALPVTQMSNRVSNYATFGGLITRSTAERLQIPSGQTVWVYTDLTDGQLELLATAPAVVGFDPQWMIAYEAPAKRSEPPVTLLLAFSTGLMASLVVMYYTSATTRDLRPVLAAVQAVGVRSRWLTTVATVQVGLVVLAAMLFAFLGALAAAFLSTQTWIRGAQLHIPWMSVGLLVVTFLLGVVATQIMASRRLSVTER